ncbi:unnamed protein product [Didymodactylos carnosus]|uniref:OTU domain-containing protein n=1 Tax=Didymodactylos carnosus TaxID=1234261 RepID=A0A815LP74_9BILA|nr:unnamed protein product [Didymodactylos carnosus]CAF1412589.1 unnamed protein product [Didymodactylos carnosus]CAF3579811.1 unnamed protein product [Didymodactylos carnosus]CAF4300352.1 unnamed protein product [Didymodactylos carnosus]
MHSPSYGLSTARWYYSPSTPTRYYEPVAANYSYYTRPPSASAMKSYNVFNRFSNSQNHLVYDDAQLHERRLNRNLEQYGFSRRPVKGDGNCLFYALTEGIAYEMRVDENFAYSIHALMNLPQKTDMTHFANLLRQLCVDQWRTNQQYYSNFVDKKVTFLKEVKKFSKNGVSESILGDIVPLTICNALNINVTIFTSVSDLPVIEVKSESPGKNVKTIYLAYNQHGAGHYDAAQRYA